VVVEKGADGTVLLATGSSQASSSTDLSTTTTTTTMLNQQQPMLLFSQQTLRLLDKNAPQAPTLDDKIKKIIDEVRDFWLQYTYVHTSYKYSRVMEFCCFTLFVCMLY